ncbi:MAG: VWA domain-containing protein [Chloroflexia bacterium]|nr:VWA domain-containing protein [Chloroflexia bacterium]
MTQEVSIRCSLARPNLPVASSPVLAYLLLEIMPTQVLAQVRVPVNVCFVLDRSGSMSGDKIDRVREATKLAVDSLDDEDVVSVVTFSSKVKVEVEGDRARNRKSIQQKIAKISAGGGTVISKAVEAGLEELNRTQQGGSFVQRLILLTDGETEKSDELRCRQVAERAGQMGVPITALGISRRGSGSWNEDLLIEMGDRSGGTSDEIKEPDDIVPYFQARMQDFQGTVVQNALMTLRLVQGVSPRAVYRVIPLIANLGYKPLGERDVTVELGELVKDQGQTLLVELLLSPKPAGAYRVAQAEVSYDVPVLQRFGQKVRADVIVNFSHDPNLVQEYDPRLMNIVEKVTAFKLQTRALSDAEAGDIPGATQKLRAAATRLLDAGEADLAQTMQEEAQRLEQQGQISSAGAKTIKFGGRKTVRLTDLQQQ